MMKQSFTAVSLVVVLAVATCLILPGCSKQSTAAVKTAPTVVVVSNPVARKVTDYAVFTGRTEAVKSVEIRARVDGYLIQMPFKEGADVKKGDLLFQIDPRPYQATYDQAAAQVALCKARLTQANADFSRTAELGKTPGAISKQDVDRYRRIEGRSGGPVASGRSHGRVGPVEFGIHERRLANRWHGEPVLRDRGQSRAVGPNGRRHVADENRIDRSHVRRFFTSTSKPCSTLAG